MVSIKDKDLYAIAGQEVANGVIDTGLWTKAFSDSGGNDARAKALYIKMRVVDLLAQRAEQQKQLKQRARIQQQQNIEQQKQQALLVKQHEAQLEAEKWEAKPWGVKLFTTVVGIGVIFVGIFVIFTVLTYALSFAF